MHCRSLSLIKHLIIVRIDINDEVQEEAEENEESDKEETLPLDLDENIKNG